MKAAFSFGPVLFRIRPAHRVVYSDGIKSHYHKMASSSTQEGKSVSGGGGQNVEEMGQGG